MIEASYEYGQDPRYGNVRITLDGGTTQMIIIEDGSKTLGFNYCRGEIFGPLCLCNAWDASECSCGLYGEDYD